MGKKIYNSSFWRILNLPGLGLNIILLVSKLAHINNRIQSLVHNILLGKQACENVYILIKFYVLIITDQRQFQSSLQAIPREWGVAFLEIDLHREYAICAKKLVEK